MIVPGDERPIKQINSDRDEKNVSSKSKTSVFFRPSEVGGREKTVDEIKTDCAFSAMQVD